MKRISNRILYSTLFIVGLLTSCELQQSAEWEPSVLTREDRTMTAWELINKLETDDPGSFSDLITALNIIDRVDLYESEGSRTYFAPSNAAFEAFISFNSSYGWTNVANIPVNILEKLVLFQTIDSKVYLSTADEVTESSDDLQVTSLNGNTARIYRTETFRIRYKAERDIVIRTSNFEPLNGALHVVDQMSIRTVANLDTNY